ncbi:MAG: hypothetical protein AAFU77_03465 [Myxococcota bacterium]
MRHVSLSRLPALSPAAVKLLVQRRTLRILESATPEPCTVREVADDLGIRVENAWHHVRAMVRAELLEESGHRKRAGRAQKLYVARDTEFFVPATRRVSTVGRQLGRLLEFSLEHEDATLGEHFYFDGTRWRVEKLYDPSVQLDERQQDVWCLVELDGRQRLELRRDVQKLIEKYQSKASPGGDACILRFACASLPASVPAAVE